MLPVHQDPEFSTQPTPQTHTTACQHAEAVESQVDIAQSLNARTGCNSRSQKYQNVVFIQENAEQKLCYLTQSRETGCSTRACRLHSAKDALARPRQRSPTLKLKPAPTSWWRRVFAHVHGDCHRGEVRRIFSSFGWCYTEAVLQGGSVTRRQSAVKSSRPRGKGLLVGRQEEGGKEGGNKRSGEGRRRATQEQGGGCASFIAICVGSGVHMFLDLFFRVRDYTSTSVRVTVYGIILPLARGCRVGV